MSWNLEGKRVNGFYMGQFPYTGMVVESRVKYGGQVQHTVQVDAPFEAYGSVRDHVLVSVAEINRILSPQGV
jgi:hypothetical protein